MKEIGVAGLGSLEAGYPVPFVLRLASSAWVCSDLLRVLPGRRIVLRVTPLAPDADGSERILKAMRRPA